MRADKANKAKESVIKNNFGERIHKVKNVHV